MAAFFDRVVTYQYREFPATIFYAFKQRELKREGLLSTGWETFLQGMVDAGLKVIATWPMRTEMANRLRDMGSAALASSVVIVCRPRPKNATLATRRELLDALQAELPRAVRLLQDQSIAPVDMAQSAIGARHGDLLSLRQGAGSRRDADDGPNCSWFDQRGSGRGTVRGGDRVRCGHTLGPHLVRTVRPRTGIVRGR